MPDMGTVDDEFVRDVVARAARSRRTVSIVIAGGAALLGLALALRSPTPAAVLLTMAIVALGWGKWNRRQQLSIAIHSDTKNQAKTLRADEVRGVELVRHGNEWGARLVGDGSTIELHGLAAASALLRLLAARDGEAAGTESEARAALQSVQDAGGPNAYLLQLASRPSSGQPADAKDIWAPYVMRTPNDALPLEAALRKLVGTQRETSGRPLSSQSRLNE